LGNRRPTAFIQLEPIAASPEILCQRFLELAANTQKPSSHRAATFQRLLQSIANSKPRSVFLLDEVTEIRTLSYFPGVDRPLESFLETLAKKQAPSSVATSRFPLWIASSLAELSKPTQSRIEVVPLPPLSAPELEAAGIRRADLLVLATGGLPVHIQPLLERMESSDGLAEALATEIQTDGHLEAECRATLGQLLHRARGYGACKAVLHVLAAEEGLRLTEVARQLGRTAGSVRDYLRWLEEVELITARDKRFFFVDPILRLWLRLHGRGVVPTDKEVMAEVETHLGGERPLPEPRPEPIAAPVEEPEEAPQYLPPPDETDDLIEID
jgi:hypothetical protein